MRWPGVCDRTFQHANGALQSDGDRDIALERNRSNSQDLHPAEPPYNSGTIAITEERMNPLVRNLFHELADLPHEERERVLAEQGISPEIRAEVESLLTFDSPEV